MKKIYLAIIALLLVPALGFATTLTDDQKERLNEIGAPSSISSSFRTRLGDLIETALGGVEVSVAGGTGTMPVVDSTGKPVSVILKTTNASETCNLAAGAFEGQRITISHVVDGGSCTLTPATTSNFATCALSDSGDTVTVRYVDSTVGWVVEGAVSTSGSGAPACTQ